ncbi:hypothetical protein Q5P01_008575 [Channa striata]|uniref:Uncharacterized protein n=1 Tax=Channa striata TaxID=64152 RepID=A0AA88N3N2_CHASR|nr:hypothetical protein Q5P01_008575 [Channa striata]
MRGEEIKGGRRRSTSEKAEYQRAEERRRVSSTELNHDTVRPLWPETPGHLTADGTEEDEEELCGKGSSGGGTSSWREQGGKEE